jgi:hypothetical protein
MPGLAVALRVAMASRTPMPPMALVVSAQSLAQWLPTPTTAGPRLPVVGSRFEADARWLALTPG